MRPFLPQTSRIGLCPFACLAYRKGCPPCSSRLSTPSPLVPDLEKRGRDVSARAISKERKAKRLDEGGRPPGAPRRRRLSERAARLKTQICRKRGETAQQKIVLASGRGGAYYSILRQARKREGRKPRGAPPQAGTLRTGYWTRDDHNSQ